jgi:hypothetical protein
MEPRPETSPSARRQSAGNRRPLLSGSPRTVSAVIPRPGRKARTTLARRRRLNALVRELARDLGFELTAVTLAERGVLHQCATLMLQVEVAQDALVRGAVVDPDTTIRLSSEARRLLAGLRKRAGKPEGPPSARPWSPLRHALSAAAAIGRVPVGD